MSKQKKSKRTPMELQQVWHEIEQFQQTALATTAALHADATETAYVRAFLQVVSLDALFSALQIASDEADERKVKLACGAINRVMGCDGNGNLFFQPEMLPFIVGGLRHSERAARVLTLNQLIAHIKKDPNVEQIKALANKQLIDELCSVMADEEIDIASKAADVLALFSQVKAAALHESTLDALVEATRASDVTESSVELMRYLEAIARIAAHDDQCMLYAIHQGAVDTIFDRLKSRDTLFVMNVLDLVPKFCQTRAGILHVLESDPLIGDSALRLIGEISATAATLHIDSWNWSDPMLSKTFIATIEERLQGSEPLQQIAAMDAIAAFASTSERELKVLLQHSHLCKLLLQFGMSTKTPVKVNCLHAVARILSAPTRLHCADERVQPENAPLWSLNERLFLALGSECRQQSTVTLLMELLRQPFDEVRIAVFALLRAVAAQNNDWGVRALRSYGGLFEFLLDRTTEPTKETREWKFAVVDAVLAWPFQQSLDAVTLAKLREHMQKGPYVGAGSAQMELEAA
ncbi:hypothetical protein P43SY_003114 [Pythium insidiosum]|uniref:26S proteasome non-ATPase regulatory subunit 5 n=1 Tax=Pythium insidiosum TaxID=114742 RepID=A0AAD5MHU8_PYTIN|nr:hypothetical protein P43SY_003114 [Pythium insidiosum]